MIRSLIDTNTNVDRVTSMNSAITSTLFLLSWRSSHDLHLSIKILKNLDDHLTSPSEVSSQKKHGKEVANL